MESSPAATGAAGRGRTLVRFVDALPGTGTVDLSADDRMVFSGIGFKTITDYLVVHDNASQLRMRAAGADSILADNNEGLRNDARSTVISMPGVNGQPRLRVLTDEPATDPSKTRLRVIQAVPRLGEVDVAVVGDQEPLFRRLTYASEARYRELPPMTATIEIRQDQSMTAPVRIEALHLEAGHGYTIVIVGDRAGTVEAITFDDRTQAATARPAGN
jgi:hypothetical protein